MPKDSRGKFHLNTQLAQAADKAGPPKAPKSAPPAPATPEPDGDEGAPVEHPGMAAVRAMHAASPGKHAAISANDDGSFTAHHVGEDGEPQGPHDAENLEQLKQNLDQFFTEEQIESQQEAMEPQYSMGGESLAGI